MNKSFVISLLVVTMLSIGLQTAVVGTVATSSGPSLVFSVAADQGEAANPVDLVQSDLSGYALAYIDHDERAITVAITDAAVIECAMSVATQIGSVDALVVEKCWTALPVSDVNDVVVHYTVTVVREGTVESIQDAAIVETRAGRSPLIRDCSDSALTMRRLSGT